MIGYRQRLSGLFLLVSIGSVTHPAAAGTPLMLPSVTPWNVDYAPDSCTWLKAFGDKDRPTFLSMEWFAPTDSFQMSVSGAAVPEIANYSPVWVTFGQQKAFKRQGALPATAGKDKAILIGRISLAPPQDEAGDEPPTPPRPDPEQEEAITTIAIRMGLRNVVFQTGSLRKPFDALRQCTDRLVKSWGLDPEVQARVASLPQPVSSPQTWIRPGDYPQTERRLGKQGVVNFRLMVDTLGKATSCEIQKAIANEAFRKATCAALMRRATFRPAIDAQGQPLESYFVSNVSWIMQ